MEPSENNIQSSFQFNPQQDAEELSKAMKEGSKGEKKILEIVGNRTRNQRQIIKDYYTKLYYNRDLITDLQKSLGGNFKEVVIALFYTPIDYDCYQLRKAMKGFGTDEETLIEIIATRPPNVLDQIKAKYFKLFNRDLIKDIKSETSGHFREALLSLLEADRAENSPVNIQDCQAYAKQLYEAGEKRLGTNEKVFIDIFTKRSLQEFYYISQEYQKITKHTISQAVNNEFSGDTKKCLNTIISSIFNPSEYFAGRINLAVKGLGTNDNMLIRVLVTREEIDLAQIRQLYKQLFGKEMIEDIKGDTSGNYRSLLVLIASH